MRKKLRKMAGWNLVLLYLGLLALCSTVSAKRLSETGKNVCLSPRDSSLVCCSGWAQEDDACTIPLCEGPSACAQDEFCVFPGVCTCKPGFYGFQCKTPCPPEFWGPDCRRQCRCYPHARCDAATGACLCPPTRWGNLCQHTCTCGHYGLCDPVHGNCTCNVGWWGSHCNRQCMCHPGTSTCDPSTGRCICKGNYWGSKCNMPCHCKVSPCHQLSGICQCLSGWWGPNCEGRCECDPKYGVCNALTGDCVCQLGYKSPFCREQCSPGTYGSGCTESCGHCEGRGSCSILNGSCTSCSPGWIGSRCDHPCPHGFYGRHCQEVCPRCKREEPCDPVTGACSHCQPGWNGPRCDQPCPDGTFGDDCSFLCSSCHHGSCDHITGSCVCHVGFQGASCNSSCPDQMFGVNCSLPCDCGGDGCHHVTGGCPYSTRVAIIAGILVPLLVLLLAVLLCCCCCGSPANGKDRVAVEDGSTLGRMKYHVYTVLANMTVAMPCLTFWSSGLPRVTVSHHDPELTFNHSFIEPPSAGWITDSFETDEDGEVVYCVPPREDVPAIAGGELQFQELSSKCNMFTEPPTFSSEDMSLAFGIPRTSSIAKSKRPSVSFAEGTKFNPKERRGSTQEPGRKLKGPWGVLMISSLQGVQRGDEEAEGKREDPSDETQVSTEEQSDMTVVEAESERHGSTPSRTYLAVPGSRRLVMSQPQVLSNMQEVNPGAENALTTVYVTVGKPGPASKPETSSEGPVQAMLRRLGSLQRQREDTGKSKSKGTAMSKPPRRKLGSRASMWEQAANSGQTYIVLRKPSRRKHALVSPPCPEGNTDVPQDSTTPQRPLSSILKSVPVITVQEAHAVCNTDLQADAHYEAVAPMEDVSSEIIANENLTLQDEEPKYENIYLNC